MQRKKIGLALGGGTLRGMAHIGALETLNKNQIYPNIITGCSSGALVAAAYACEKLEDFKDIALSMNKKTRRQMLDFCLTGEGIIRGNKLRSFFEFITAGKKFKDIKELKLAFVGTDALTGKEVIIDEGSIAEALEITTALPGISPLKRYKERLVFDGGTAMMVPAKVAYRFGAEKVIAIDVGAKRSIITRLIGDARKIVRKTRISKFAKPIFEIQEKIINSDEHRFLVMARELMQKLDLLDDYVNGHFNFIETYLIGLRAISSDYERGLFDDSEADISIRPKVFHIKRSDVGKINELIQEGKRAMESKIQEIERIITMSN